jgi:hypothetical protein
VKRRVLSYLATFAVAYLVILLLLRLLENSFIFFPGFPGRLSGDWNPRELPKEDVWFTASDGVKLHAWWVPAEGAEFTFVCFHGNAANIALRAEAYAALRALPANVLAVEYRGYGKSEGSPSEQGIYLDAQAAHDYLTGPRGIRPERLIAYGQSLGTAVAVDLATQRPVGGLVLEAPFPSAAAVARRVYFFLPGITLALRAKFETARKLATLRVPVLVAHCRQDPVIAFSFGEQVFAAANEPKKFYPVEAYCHEEISLVAPREYAPVLREFLTMVASHAPPAVGRR